MILLSISLFFACYRYCGAPQSAIYRNKKPQKTAAILLLGSGFFISELGQLWIRILRYPGSEHWWKPGVLHLAGAVQMLWSPGSASSDKTLKLPLPVSALHHCREWACQFRFSQLCRQCRRMRHLQICATSPCLKETQGCHIILIRIRRGGKQYEGNGLR